MGPKYFQVEKSWVTLDSIDAIKINGPSTLIAGIEPEKNASGGRIVLKRRRQ